MLELLQRLREIRVHCTFEGSIGFLVEAAVLVGEDLLCELFAHRFVMAFEIFDQLYHHQYVICPLFPTLISQIIEGLHQLNMKLVPQFIYKYTLPNEEPISLIIQSPGELYLGNLDCVLNPHILSHFKISHVLSICTEEKITLGPPLRQLHLDLHDNMETRISESFQRAFRFIDDALNSNSNVLIHCAAGISRSSTIVIAYLMKSRKMLLQDALRFVKQRRSFVRPNPGFLMQLLEFEKQLFGAIKSVLTAELTPFDVQRDYRYAPKSQSHYALSVPIRKVEGLGAVRKDQKQLTDKPVKLTRVAESLASIQPKAFKI